MKIRIPRIALLLGVFTLGALISGEVLAHNTQGFLRESRKATAAWATTCFGNNAKLVYRVSQRKSTPFRVQLTVSKDGVSNIVTAPGSKGKFSPYGELAQGRGEYIMTLSKIAKRKSTLGKVIYEVESHCDPEHDTQTVPKPKR